MTPQYIMRVGVTDYLNELKDGQGNYVSRVSGCIPPPYWDNLEWHEREALSQIENLDWYEKYTDSGADVPENGILIADWNYVSTRVQNILERAGFELDWPDTTSRCDGCSLCIATEAQTMDDAGRFHYFDGSVLCAKCIKSDPEDYLEDITDTDNVGQVDVDPTTQGYVLLETAYDWQDAHKVKAKLKEKGFDHQVLMHSVPTTPESDHYGVFYKPDNEHPVEAAKAYLPSAQYKSMDICCAYYEYASQYHGGQWSKEYAIFGSLHRLQFDPGGSEVLATENAKAIYTRLVMLGGKNIRDRR